MSDRTETIARLEEQLNSFDARVRSDARSDPLSGSVNTAVGKTLPDAMAGSQRAFCCSVPSSCQST